MTERIGISSGDARFDSLIETFLERCRHGDDPSVAEYAERYPEFADRIQTIFPALLLMEHGQPEDAATETTGGGASVVASISGQEITQLGDYRILREIGRGGMGIVYEAEQRSLGRHVALKLLPDHHLLDRRRLDRFRREAKAAALLQHPNIVPVYGVGEENGVHYYAMQFVPGQSLDQVLVEIRRLRDRGGSAGGAASTLSGGHDDDADEMDSSSDEVPAATPASPPDASGEPSRSPSSSSLLSLDDTSDSATSSDSVYFRRVARIGARIAEALAYAHSEGVLHRDMKPSNVLLDSSGVVWITDFGLAKIEGEDITKSGEVVGTLAYMSPERFRGWSDPRSDVYGLGVTLYELLTLEPAFHDVDRARLLKKVTEEEPVAPRKRNPRIPKDLETIVSKAMAKEPGGRYATADELATDLQRFLDGEPILARPASAVERGVKWARRHPTRAALVLVSVVATLTVLIGSIWYSTKLSAAVEEKTVAADRAEGNFQEAMDAVEKLLTRVSEFHLAEQPHMERLRQVLLEEALAFYERFLQERSTDPAVRLETGRAFSRVGRVQRLLGDDETAASSYRRGETILEDLRDEFPEDPVHLLNLAEAYAGRGVALENVGRGHDAEAVLGKARKTLQSLRTKFSDRREYDVRLAAVLAELGLIFMKRGEEEDLERASGLLEEAISLDESFLELAPDESDVRSQLIEAESRLAQVFVQLGRLDDADGALLDLVNHAKALSEDYPERPRYKADLAKAYTARAGLLKDIERHEEARDFLQQSIDALEGLSRDFPSVPLYQASLGGAYNQLAISRKLSGDFDAAARDYETQIDVYENLTTRFPANPTYRLRLAISNYNFGILLQDSGQTEKGEERYVEAIEACKKLLAEFPDFPDRRKCRYLLAAVYRSLAVSFWSGGQYVKAHQTYPAALELLEALVTENPKDGNARWVLALTHNLAATVLDPLGRHREAVDACGRALKELRRLAEDFPERIVYVEERARTLNTLGLIEAESLAQASQAEKHHLQAIDLLKDICEKHSDVPEFSFQLALSYSYLGDVLLRQPARHAEARKYWIEAKDRLEELETRVPENVAYSSHLGNALRGLAEAQTLGGEIDKAEESLERAVKKIRAGLDKAPDNETYRKFLKRCDAALGEVEKGRTSRPR